MVDDLGLDCNSYSCLQYLRRRSCRIVVTSHQCVDCRLPAAGDGDECVALATNNSVKSPIFLINKASSLMLLLPPPLSISSTPIINTRPMHCHRRHCHHCLCICICIACCRLPTDAIPIDSNARQIYYDSTVHLGRAILFITSGILNFHIRTPTRVQY